MKPPVSDFVEEQWKQTLKTELDMIHSCSMIRRPQHLYSKQINLPLVLSLMAADIYRRGAFRELLTFL